MFKQTINQRGSIGLIILAVLVVAAIGGVGAYVATDGFGSRSKDTNNSETTAEGTEQKEEVGSEATGLALLEKAMLGNGAVKCTYKQADNSGTAYIASEGKFRVDFTSADGNGHMVHKDKTVYIWGDGEAQGFKMSTAAAEGEAEASEEFNDYSPEKLKENYSEENMNCEAYTFDDKLLDLPANVEFVSFADMFNPENAQ